MPQMFPMPFLFLTAMVSTFFLLSVSRVFWQVSSSNQAFHGESSKVFTYEFYQIW